MSSNLKVNSLVPATGTEIGIGTTGGSIDFRCPATFGGNVTIGGTLTYDEVINIDSIGVITARSNIDCNGSLDVDGHTDLDNVSIAGVTTFAQKINLSDNFIRNCRGFNSGNEQARIVVKAGDNSAGGGLRIVEYYNDDTTLFSSEIANFYTTGIELKENVSITGDLTIPSYIKHLGDTNTMIGFPSDDSFSVTTNNITRMTFTGNFIDLPDAGTFRFGGSQDLQIYHGSGGASNIVHSNTSQPLIISATGAGSIRFDTNSNERLTINSSGQLIMTNAATQTFADFSTTNNNTRGLISLAGKDGSGNAVTLKMGGFGDTSRAEIFTHSNHGLGFATNNAATQMVLGTNGCLSIGKVSSQGKGLEVYQSADAAIRIQNSTTGTGANDGILLEAGASQALVWNYESTPLKFGTAGTERFAIDQHGNLSHNSAGSGYSYFKGSSEYVFGSQYSSPPAGGVEADFQIHTGKSRAAFSINSYYNNAGTGYMQFVSSRSNTKGVLGTKSQSGDYLADIRFMGDNGTNYNSLVNAAQIYVKQASNISDGATSCAGQLFIAVGNSSNVVEEKVRIDTGGGITLRNTDCHRGLIFIHDGDGGDSCTSMANVQGSGGRGIVETKIYGIAANTTTDLAKSHWGGLALIGWSGTGHQGTEQVSFGYHRTPTSQYKAVWVGNLTVTYTMSHYTLRISHNASNDLNFWCILIGV